MAKTRWKLTDEQWKKIEPLLPKLSKSKRGGTIEGGIFFTEEYFFVPDTNVFDMYVLSEYTDEMLQETLNAALEGGYGRDKSTGKGIIEVVCVKPACLPKADNPNAVMLLGPCVPAASDPVRGFWTIKAKQGKLGGHWAVTEHYRKKTVMMLQAGSLLLTDSPKSFYGSIVHKVHNTLPEVVHYGLAMALPLTAASELLNLQLAEAI